MSDYDDQFRKHWRIAKCLGLMSATIDSATAAAIDQAMQASNPLQRGTCSRTTDRGADPLPKARFPGIEKRKLVEEVELAIQPVAKKPCPEVPWHPLFNRDSPRVTLLSNDNQRLCVDKRLLIATRYVLSPFTQYNELLVITPVLLASGRRLMQ